MRRLLSGIYFLTFLCCCLKSIAQNRSDSLLQDAGLRDCIDYAIKHQPLVKQSQIDEAIAENIIKTSLADWYPQLGLNYTLQHYLKLPTSFVPDAATGVKRPTQFGVRNSSNFQFALTQSIFSPDLLLANRTL